MALTYLTAATASAAMDAIVPASTNMAISLHISTGPGNTGANEETGTGYTYQQGQFIAASSGTKTGPNSTVTFTATGWTGTIGYFGVWETTHTTWKCGGALSSSLTPPASATIIILSAGLSLAVQG